MKKFMIPMAAMLLIAGASQAQTTTPKKASREPLTQKEAVAKKKQAADKSTASVTSTEKMTAEGKTTAVARKHHHKKVKPLTKTAG